MPIELTILAVGVLLLFAHIMAAALLKTRQFGIKWAVSARSEALPPQGSLAGRLDRAQANFQETFPIAIVALLAVVVAGRTSYWTATGGWIWLGARIIYLPLYAAGIPVIRTLAWIVSLAGLLITLWPLFGG